MRRRIFMPSTKSLLVRRRRGSRKRGDFQVPHFEVRFDGAEAEPAGGERGGVAEGEDLFAVAPKFSHTLGGDQFDVVSFVWREEKFRVAEIVFGEERFGVVAGVAAEACLGVIPSAH